MRARAFIVIMFAVLVLLAARFSTESLAASGLPSWRPPAKMLNQLETEMWMGEYAMRPPAGSILQKLRVSPPRSGFTRMWAWTGPRREDGSIAGLVVKVVSLKTEPASLDRAVRDELAALKMRKKGRSPTPTEYGRINGLAFAVTRWTGTNDLRGLDIAGFTYVAVDGNSLITISSEDAVGYDVQTLPITEASARTFRRR